MSNEPIFHLKLLDKYQVIFDPGTHVVQVSSTVTESNFILDEHSRYLVSLRVIAAEDLGDLLVIVPDETTRVPFDEVGKFFMTGALWENEADETALPVKGERVIATFEEVEDKLRCTHIELLPREELDYLNINDISEFRKSLVNLINKKNI